MQFGAELLFDLRHGLLPALRLRAGWRLGGWGLAVEFGYQRIETLAGYWGVCYTGH
jgi:hypothetical protein